MGMWVIVNWWVWPVPDFHFRKLEAMVFVADQCKVFILQEMNSLDLTKLLCSLVAIVFCSY